MTKPSWDDAPEWAEWLAMDQDSEWWWFENEPGGDDNAEWLPNGGSQRAKITCCEDTWTESLEPRPKRAEAE